MFSLSVFLEILSPEVFHRVLHGGHTHLYTEESIDFLEKNSTLEKLANGYLVQILLIYIAILM